MRNQLTDLECNEPAADPIVATPSGKIRGLSRDGVCTFKGIPYGAPTGGDGRFSAPKPAASWTGVRDALHFGDHCPQNAAPPTGAFSSWAERTSVPSEDCLVLNVWTPNVGDGVKRPVMFWIHGGGYAVGSGSSPAYDGTRLAQKGDVVVVTVNHRLNVFGYLYLEELCGPDYGRSANAGHLDLVAALRWVKDNIASFGGDPGNVMIFGEFGGGGKVSALLAIPAAKGLVSSCRVAKWLWIDGSDTFRGTQLASDSLAALDLKPSRQELQQITFERAQCAEPDHRRQSDCWVCAGCRRQDLSARSIHA